MRPSAFARALGSASLGLVLASPALAQSPPAQPPSRHVFEYWFGPTVVFSGFDGTLATDYAAQLDVGESQGRTTQTLTARAPGHLGVEGGIGIFPAPRFGVQVRLNYVNRSLSGTSGPYRTTLDYTASQPPDYIPRQYHVDDTGSWPAPTGTSTQLTVTFEGAVRWEAGTTLSGTISGGLGYFRAKGTAESVAFTRYWLGGHATLFSSIYPMTLKYGPTSALGFDIGAGLGVKLAGPLDLWTDLRMFHAGDIEPDVTVVGFAENSPDHGDLPVATVDARMSPITARFSPSFVRLFVGVRIRS